MLQIFKFARICPKFSRITSKRGGGQARAILLRLSTPMVMLEYKKYKKAFDTVCHNVRKYVQKTNHIVNTYLP